MTGAEREKRAAPVLAGACLDATAVAAALASEELPWNQKKASAFGVSAADWQLALDVAGLAECDSLGTLLGVIHRAESAAAMLRAGYKPTRGAGGELSWSR